MKMKLEVAERELDLIMLCLKHYAQIINRLNKPELGNPYAALAEKLFKKQYADISKRK